MEFGKDNKVIVESLTKEQAKEFTAFLQMEIGRHAKEAKICTYHKSGAEQVGKEASALFWESAWKRHLEDITQSDNLLTYVIIKFGLE